LVRDFQPFEIAAVNQCSGNSRGFFSPRVPGGEWATVPWECPLEGGAFEDVLDRAGSRLGHCKCVSTASIRRFYRKRRFVKSLDIDHARDGEVMIAYAMNGQLLHS